MFEVISWDLLLGFDNSKCPENLFFNLQILIFIEFTEIVFVESDGADFYLTYTLHSYKKLPIRATSDCELKMF